MSRRKKQQGKIKLISGKTKRFVIGEMSETTPNASAMSGWVSTIALRLVTTNAAPPRRSLRSRRGACFCTVSSRRKRSIGL